MLYADFHAAVLGAILPTVIGHNRLIVGHGPDFHALGIHITLLDKIMNHACRTCGRQVPVGTEATGFDGDVIGMSGDNKVAITLIQDVRNLLQYGQEFLLR